MGFDFETFFLVDYEPTGSMEYCSLQFKFLISRAQSRICYKSANILSFIDFGSSFLCWKSPRPESLPNQFHNTERDYMLCRAAGTDLELVNSKQ